MRIRYSREHLRESVALAITLGMLWGAWLGARVSDASIIEGAAAFAAVWIAYTVGFSKIDKRHAESEG